MKPILSVIGLYNYDNTIFSGWTIPPALDAEVLIDRVFMECGELTVMYPDPAIFKRFLTKWSAAKLPQWQRIYNVSIAQYDMLHNYDRTESETINRRLERETDMDVTTTGTGSDTGRRTIDRDATRGNTGTVTDAGTYSGTDTRSVTGFNSGTLQTAEQNVHSDTTGNTTTNNLLEQVADDTTESVTSSRTESGTQSTEGTVTDSGSETRNVRAYGNIGVTTSQQMLESELELAGKLDVYGIIVDDFARAFTIGVY